MTFSLQENIMKPTKNLVHPYSWNQLNLMHSYSQRAFQWYQEHSKRYCDFKEGLGDLNMTNKTNKLPSSIHTLYISLYQSLYPDRVKRKSTSHGLSDSAGHLMVESLHTHENHLMCSCTTIWKGFYLVWWSCFSSSCASLGLVAIFKYC